MESVDNSLFEISPEGDVIIPTTWDSPAEQLPVATAESDFDPSEDLDMIRQSADFRNRNIRLMMAADHVGNQRQAEGAIKRSRWGYKVSQRYADQGHMAEIASERDDRASEAIRRACGSCALAKYCGLSQDDLQNRLRDAKARQRFKNRIIADNYSKNDHLCETNLTPGRLSADQA